MRNDLTALDATFLELEQSDEGAHMHIGGAMVFAPLPEGGTPSREEVRDSLASRLHMLPRYGQRLSETHIGGLHWPHWEDDPRFDIDSHVRHATLPAPGEDEELLDWISDFYSHRLDRMRPLWETVVLDGLAGGRWALVWKTHHCLVDGVGSVDIAHTLLDTDPDASRGPASARAPAGDEDPGVLRSWLPGPPDAVRQATGAAMDVVRGSVHAALHPRDVLRQSSGLIDLLVHDEVVAAPPSSLNGPIGGTRRMGVVRVPLSELRAVKEGLGGKVNDAALTAVTGGLRALLLHRGEELPEAGLRAMVPVNIRVEHEHGELGNRIVSLFAHLPVAIEDPLERYEAVVDDTRKLKTGGLGDGAGALLGLTGLAPPVIHSTLARSLFATRLFNVTVTNVPGPSRELYASGARLVEVIPVVPLAAEHALGVAIFSYAGNVVFGLNADRESVPDLDVFADGIADTLAELQNLVHHSTGA